MTSAPTAGSQVQAGVVEECSVGAVGAARQQQRQDPRLPVLGRYVDRALLRLRLQVDVRPRRDQAVHNLREKRVLAMMNQLCIHLSHWPSGWVMLEMYSW